MNINNWKNKQTLLVILVSISTLIFLSTMLVSSKKAMAVKKKKQEIISDINSSIESSDLLGSMAIVRDGKIVYTTSFGEADHENHLPNSPDLLYPIASMQKRMTAVIIAQLIREGKLAYESTIERFYPNLEHADVITIRDLLNHTSGYIMPEVASSTVLTTEKQQLNNVFETSIYNGQYTFQYSNGNYSLLAGIISQIEQTPYKDSLKKRILNPLHLAHTYLWDDVPTDQFVVKEYFNDTGSDYEKQRSVYSKELMSTLLGAGNVYSTASDLSQFQLSLNNNTLLTPEEYAELFPFASQEEVMMYGNISSDGKSGGYSSYFYGDITKQNFVVFLANQTSNDYPDQLFKYVYEQLLLF